VARRNRLLERLEYERCRTYGHAWDEFTPDRRLPDWGVTLALRCTRCTMERLDVIDALGDVGQRRYIQPDGYHLSRDETPSRQSLRLDLLSERESRRRRR